MIHQKFYLRSLVMAAIFLIRLLSYSNAEDIEIRYSIPRIMMKLILVDDNVPIDQFQLEIDTLTQLHLVNFFIDELPIEATIVNRNQFRSVTLTSVVERVPVYLDDNSTDIELSVMRSEFEGYANFSANEDEVDISVLSKELIKNTTDLRLITLDAFRQRIGFWQFADLIKANDLLAVTGKLQILVDNVIVAEADIENGTRDETDDASDTDDEARLTIVLICIAGTLVACVGGLGALIWFLRHREFQFEKKSIERRETSKQVRMKSLGNSTSSFGNSVRSNGDVSLISKESISIDVAGVQKTTERRTSSTSLASYEWKADMRGDFNLKTIGVQGNIDSSKRVGVHGDLDAQQNTSDESLIDSTANETTNLDYEATNQPKQVHQQGFQDDEDESEYLSVQSASERDEYVDPSTTVVSRKNSIISSHQINRPIKRNSNVSIGNGPPILKSAIKNSHEGRQYVTDTTRKYITYNNSMASSFVDHSSPRSKRKVIGNNINDKMKHLSVPTSTKRGSITSGKLLFSPPRRTSETNSSVDETSKSGINLMHSKDSRHDRSNNGEAFDDGIMIQTSSSNLSFDIMGNSNSDKASISPEKVKAKSGYDDDSNQSSLSFCFT